MKVVIDDCRLERMDVYTDPLNDKIKRQAAEITRLLKENAQIKDDYELALKVCEDDTKARTAGQEEAWKLALKLRYMDYEDKVECFGLEYDGKEKWIEIMEKYTYTEAAAKVAEWERKKEEICVGDVVRFKENHRVEFCVTNILDDRFLYGVSAEGDVYADRNNKLFEKTGRHIDVASMMAQIGGGSDE